MASEFPKPEIIVHAASVTDEAAIRSIVRSSGKIDIVVSAAAICHTTTPPSTIAASELSEILQTNTVGPFLVISTILHERSIQGWDHEVKVIYVSSALSHTHICHLSGYAASKAAMNLLCLHLNMEWNSRGVSVFAIHPGLIYTTLTGKVFPKESPIWEDGEFHRPAPLFPVDPVSTLVIPWSRVLPLVEILTYILRAQRAYQQDFVCGCAILRQHF